ncbi:helix-hairpin-helix domain-containing protein [Flavobacteriaceae bacterium R38]|nr:helix-hairpin-helix domain-containing protein [Flavobacteriaceae bacterium R38]
MKNLKSHFVFARQQRSGIFFLMLLIVLFQLVYFFVDFSSEDNIHPDDTEILAFQEKIDSIRDVRLTKSSRIFPFNPNYISDDKGYTLGMSVEEIDRLLLFRSQGQFVNSAEEFQKVTKVSDSLLAIISPYFKFPEWVNKQNNKAISKKTYDHKEGIRKNSIKKDLNTATAEELQIINGIGAKLSARIVKYRELLGGYSLEDQLYEVYGLEDEVVKNVLNKFKIITQPEIKKLDINTVSIKELSKIPYLSYEEAKKIISYRSKFGRINSINDLTKIQDFPLEKINRIGVYLSID